MRAAASPTTRPRHSERASSELAASAGGVATREKARHSVSSGRCFGSSSSSGLANASYRTMVALLLRSAARRSSFAARSAFRSAFSSSSTAPASLSGMPSAAGLSAAALVCSAPPLLASFSSSTSAGGFVGGSRVAASSEASSLRQPRSASPGASQLGSPSLGLATYRSRCAPRFSHSSSIGLAPPWPWTVASPRPA
eukprot:scaffold114214_cov30-Tisochrysis_lutea.AAC.8